MPTGNAHLEFVALDVLRGFVFVCAEVILTCVQAPARLIGTGSQLTTVWLFKGHVSTDPVQTYDS